MKIRTIFTQFKWQFSFTFFLILLEALIELLFPLFIGFAIDGAIHGTSFGAMQLGGLGLAIILIGGGRRFYDSRFYAQVYQKFGSEIISNMSNNDPSLKTARLGMIQEVIEFLENALPALITTIIGILGVVVIIASLNFKIFIGSLIATFLIFLIYFLTSNRTTYLNSSFNNELETQVTIITTGNKKSLDQHLKNLMKWNIKLSDLEVVNFSISWIVLIGFLVVSILLSTQSGIIEYGVLFSLIMYVFQYIESVITLPLFYQNWLRLEEIKERLAQI